MRDVRRESIALLAVLPLAIGLAACGDGDDTASTANRAAMETSRATGSSGPSANRGEARRPRPGSGDSDRLGGSGGGSQSNFTPKPHDDSGGGSGQFRTKGGDNSIQTFGAEADEAEFDEAAAVLHGFLDARAAGAWSAACGYLSASMAQSLQQLATSNPQLKGAGCAKLLATLSSGVARASLDEAAQADVGSVRVEGDRAFALYRGAGGERFAVPMEREDGSWKVASLAATPLF